MRPERLTTESPLAESSPADQRTEGSHQRMVGAHDLRGGKWLAAAREWLQWNTINGDSVTWGSNDVLRPNMTVKQIEELAAHVAAAAINEERERVRSNDVLGDQVAKTDGANALD